MSRYGKSSSQSHSIRLIGPGHYRLSWVVDRYYAGSRLRHPTSYTRDTDLDGAKRFAKRWDVAVPEPRTTGEDR